MKIARLAAMALATALTPVAAHAVELPAAALAAVQSVRDAMRSIDAVADGSEAAQARLGFPSKPDDDLEPEGQYREIIARYAMAYGVPIPLAHAVVEVESNYKPNVRGRAGEVGLMQIKPATARGMGFRGNVAALFVPETNIRFGMKYLAEAHKLGGGTTCRTILKYNAGHAARRMNPVSQAYCGKVMRILASD
jgi:soluble lytic murein transglycosylase-like protein